MLLRFASRTAGQIADLQDIKLQESNSKLRNDRHARNYLKLRRIFRMYYVPLQNLKSSVWQASVVTWLPLQELFTVVVKKS